MDTTEKNIMMCEKAEEIQNSWKKKHGDYYLSISHSPSQRGIALYHTSYYLAPVENIDIWIPRQDQLQEMAWDVEIKEDNIDHLLMRFYQLVTSFPDTLYGVYNSSYWTQFRTMEQKWLAFVMKTRFEKIWDGNEWIREKE